MTLTSVALDRDVRLGKPQAFRADNNFRPSSVHDAQYRLSGIISQEHKRPCVIYSYNNPRMELKTYGDRVKAARLELKLSQTALAKKAGVSQTTVSDIERGRNDGSKDIVQIARALQRSPEYLLLGKEPKVTADSDDILTLWDTLTPTERDEIRNRARHNLEVLSTGTNAPTSTPKTEAETLADEVIWLFNNVPEIGRNMLRGSIESVRLACIKGERRKNHKD